MTLGDRVEPTQLHEPATNIAREAIRVWLEQRSRASIHEGIVAYAAEHAGTEADLDSLMEAASLESWEASEDAH
jgi:hypothetical protein